MSWGKGPVFLTGAQGFVGSWLAGRLLDEGVDVVIPRREVPPGSRFDVGGLASRCTAVRADLTDHQSLVRALNEYEVRTVFHLGAQAIVGEANRSPMSTWETNIRGTYLLLDACRAVGVERVVVASSDKAYGSHDELPYREDFPLRPRFPYDVSKAATDMIARSYAITYGLPVGVARFANVYGGGDVNFSRLIPDTARALVNGRRPVIRSDGTMERDFIYASDAAAAYLAVAESLADPAHHGRAWNAGAGRPYQVLDVVQRLIAVSGRDAEPDVQGEGTPHGEIDRQYLDSSRIRAELGWEPQTDLDEGLRETWAWYEQHLGAS